MKWLNPLLLVPFLAAIIACKEKESSGVAKGFLRLDELKQGLLTSNQSGWEFYFESGETNDHRVAPMSIIRLYSDGCVVFQVNGNVSTTNEGVYSVGDDGVISIALAGYGTWRKMILFSKEGSYFLGEADESESKHIAVVASEKDQNGKYRLTGDGVYRLTGAGVNTTEPHFNECPCCRHIAIPDHFPFSACRVCFWRVDYEINQVANPDDALNIKSEVNFGLTLGEGRKNFSAIGACDARVKEIVVSEEKRKKFKPQQRVQLIEQAAPSNGDKPSN
jgi:hypothetical protein